MKKKMKLNLNDLNVQTFVTSLEDEEQKKAKGGYFTQYILECISSDLGPCCGGTSIFALPCVSDLCFSEGCLETELGHKCPIYPVYPD
jgi:hypothetical protein